MIRAWIKWRISTALDKGRPLSPPLDRWVRRDDECRRFYDASRALAERLSHDASEIIQSEVVHDHTRVRAPSEKRDGEASPPNRLRLPRPAWATSATALTIALAVGTAMWWRSLPPPPMQLPTQPASRTVTQADVVELAEILRELTTSIGRAAKRRRPQWQRTMARTGQALQKPLMREAENMAADTRGLVAAFSALIPSRRDKPASDTEEDSPAESPSTF